MAENAMVLASNLFKDQQTFSRLRANIRNVLGPYGLDYNRYLVLAQRSVVHNPKLMECTALSVATSIVEAAIRGLEIGSVEGQAYLVPFSNTIQGRKVMECQLIVGYRGFSLMAWRDAKILIQSECVYAKDKFKVTKGLNPQIIHEPYIDPHGETGQRGPLIATYAVATLPDGRRLFCVHDRQEIERRRAVSKARDGRAWSDFYEAMAAKGPIRQLGSSVIPQAVAPRLVEAAVMDERREAGAEAPPPDMALQAAHDITDAPDMGDVSEEPDATTYLTCEGILRSVVKRGKLIIATLDAGDQNPMELTTFSESLMQQLTKRVNSTICAFYRDNITDGKTYHNLVNFEAS